MERAKSGPTTRAELNPGINVFSLKI
ncbi:hypothetical protein CO2235_MP10355 [Cupriavidus oxalaticus]|uniref:Uncharacterized protein n=1 Tax=Cupriavidus oxalaticus TaxID=96344 RepID=A0A375GHJ0_9BURK|nr:hypothetical protein CO2235_U1010079 [Cupriavidus oxalaticus]SPC18144.1 hypothetical protein CO2235_MP10355 [Cupriavidus oxalaticus]